MTQIDNTRQPNVTSILTRNNWLLDKVFSIPNGRLDAATKMTVFGISQEFIRLGTPHTQLTKVWLPNVAENCGLSVQTVSSSISKLSKSQAIIKETKKVPCGPTKEKKPRIFIAFTPMMLVNPDLLFTEESNHGGKRESIRCPHCDEYHPIKKCSTFTCTGCGSLIEELTLVTTLENEAPKPEEYTDEMRRELDALIERTDSLSAAYDSYSEVSDIPDYVLSEMGGSDAIEKAAPQEIAEKVQDYDEMLDLAYEATQEFNSKKQKVDVSDYWTEEN